MSEINLNMEVTKFSFDTPHATSITSEIQTNTSCLVQAIEESLTEGEVMEFVEQLLNEANLDVEEYIVNRGLTLNTIRLEQNLE